jgi:hypothetical protein
MAMCVDCNISIVFTSQIREKLEAILEARRRHWQEDKAVYEEGYDHDQDSHETQEGEKGGETRPNGNQGDVEDVVCGS